MPSICRLDNNGTSMLLPRAKVDGMFPPCQTSAIRCLHNCGGLMKLSLVTYTLPPHGVTRWMSPVLRLNVGDVSMELLISDVDHQLLPTHLTTICCLDSCCRSKPLTFASSVCPRGIFVRH
ncbi:unnamed protein product [Sphacelaria rigidula]